MDNHDSKYALLVGKERVPVSQDVYKAYYHCRDREKYLEKLAKENNISLEGCAEKGISVEHKIATAEGLMEDAIILNEMIARMLRCVQKLDGPDRQLIVELYLNSKSEHQMSREAGIPQRTINDRKRKILSKLKKLMEK